MNSPHNYWQEMVEKLKQDLKEVEKQKEELIAKSAHWSQRSTTSRISEIKRTEVQRPRSTSDCVIWPKKSTISRAEATPPPYEPIIVDHLPNWSYHFEVLKGKLGRPVSASPFGTGIKFTPTDENEYKIIQEIIKRESRLLPSRFRLRVAIRGLFMNTELSQIRKALSGHGLEVKRVLQGTLNGKRRLFLVELKRTTGLTSPVYEIKRLLMRAVVIEPNMGLYGYKYNTYPCHQMLWTEGNKSRKFESAQRELIRIENAEVKIPNFGGKAMTSSNQNRCKTKIEVPSYNSGCKLEDNTTSVTCDNVMTRNVKNIHTDLNSIMKNSAETLPKEDIPQAKKISTDLTTFDTAHEAPNPTKSIDKSGAKLAIRVVNSMLLAIQGGTEPETAAVETILKFMDSKY